MRLILVRHAETAIRGRYCGHLDPELNQQGREQLAAIAIRLTAFSGARILSSDLRRAQQTAAAIAEHLGTPFELWPALREMWFGRWEGLTWDEVEQQFPADARAWLEESATTAPTGGESAAAFHRRVGAALDEIRRSATKDTILVTHAGVIRSVLVQAGGVGDEEAWSQTAEYGAVIPMLLPHETAPQLSFRKRARVVGEETR